MPSASNNNTNVLAIIRQRNVVCMFKLDNIIDYIRFRPPTSGTEYRTSCNIEVLYSVVCIGLYWKIQAKQFSLHTVLHLMSGPLSKICNHRVCHVFMFLYFNGLQLVS